MTELEVRKLVGLNTILKFDYLVDNIVEYKTVQPSLVDGNYINYKLSFFYEDCDTIFDYDTLDGFLGTMQVFEVTEISDSAADYNNIYYNKYKEKLTIN